MLATLSLPVLASISHATTVTISATDPSISFTPGWSRQFSQATQSSYLQANTFLSDLTATLPPLTTSVSYVAYKRAGGSTYGYTLDCEDDCILQTVNGTDPSVSDDATALQSTIFSINTDPSTQHTLRVYNIPSGAPDDASEITFDHLSVLVQDGNAAISSSITTISSTTSTSSTTITSSAASSNTSATPTSGTDSSTTASSSTASTGTESQASKVITPTSTLSSAGTGAPASILPLPVLSFASSSTTGASVATASSSSGSSAAEAETSALYKKQLAIGLTILALVVVVFVIAGLVIYLRQRRKHGSRSFKSSQRGSTGSIIPIMSPPPAMRTASLNPFSDPLGMAPAELPLDSPASSSLMQRRMESRSGSPGSAPSIPLPDLPPDARFYRMQSRPNSPVSAASKSGLWISRTLAPQVLDFTEEKTAESQFAI